MNYEISDLDDLTPGAVFIRETNGKQSKRFVLFVANSTLTGRKAELFPIRVVFANENSEIFDLDLNSFFNNCKFHNVEPELEQRLDSLFVYKEGDVITLDQAVANAKQLSDEVNEENKEVESFKGLEVENQSSYNFDGNKEEEVESAEHVATEDFLLPEVTYPITFIADTNADVKPKLAPEMLSAMLINYNQEPQFSTGYLMHRLTFAVPVNITTDEIKSCFDVANVRSDAIYPFFELSKTDFGSDARRVDWSYSMGAYPEYFNGKVSLQIVLAEPYESMQDAPVTGVNTVVETLTDSLVDPVIDNSSQLHNYEEDKTIALGQQEFAEMQELDNTSEEFNNSSLEITTFNTELPLQGTEKQTAKFDETYKNAILNS